LCQRQGFLVRAERGPADWEGNPAQPNAGWRESNSQHTSLEGSASGAQLCTNRRFATGNHCYNCIALWIPHGRIGSAGAPRLDASER
jgi:hypothetical protein